jgi:hypothetical protein
MCALTENNTTTTMENNTTTTMESDGPQLPAHRLPTSLYSAVLEDGHVIVLIMVIAWSGLRSFL